MLLTTAEEIAALPWEDIFQLRQIEGQVTYDHVLPPWPDSRAIQLVAKVKELRTRGVIIEWPVWPDGHVHAQAVDLLRAEEDRHRVSVRKDTYDRYLRTPDWKERRATALKRADNRCQVCNSPKRLNVHHRSYARVGHESDLDLIVLCRVCHAKFHDVEE